MYLVNKISHIFYFLLTTGNNYVLLTVFSCVFFFLNMGNTGKFVLYFQHVVKIMRH